jgi:hypothetical protein
MIEIDGSKSAADGVDCSAVAKQVDRCAIAKQNDRAAVAKKIACDADVDVEPA